jgi:hypothetical protein
MPAVPRHRLVQAAANQLKRNPMFRRFLFCLLLAAGLSPTAWAVQRTQFDHLTTGYELQGAHRDLSCEYCHLQGVFRGTPRTCRGCHSIGSRINAIAKPTTHVSTSDECILCHSILDFAPIVRMDHTAALGSCFSCHNGTRAPGKNPGHIQSDNNCDACHTTNAFSPARMEHANLVARAAVSCRSCHSGVQAATLPLNHIPTSQECGACHGTLSWTPARLDHAGMTRCQGCHNGGAATGKVVSHMTTSLDCSSCHRYPVWSAVAFVHSSSAYPGDHASATCIACHSSNTESAAWPSAAYRPSCAGCHATRFKPERHPKTLDGLPYNISELQNCSGACHVYGDAKLRAIARNRPAGHHKVTDSAFR